MLGSEIIERYPGKIPIIISDNKKDILEKYKFVISKEATVGDFMNILRKYSKVNEHQALFLLFNELLPPCNKQWKEIYDNFKSDDNVLYGIVTLENTFG